MTSEQRPLISALVPTKIEPGENAEQRLTWLAMALLSLHQQTLRPDEIIIPVQETGVLDGGRLERACEKLEIKTTIVVNDTPSVATSFNLGLAMCRGRYVARLDHDDIAFADRFEIQIREMREFKLRVSATQIQYLVDGVGIVNAPECPQDHDDIAKMLPHTNPIVHSTVMYDREAVLNVGGYSEGYPMCGDWTLWLKLLRADAKFRCVPRVLNYYRKHAAQVTPESQEQQAKSIEKLLCRYRAGEAI